MDVLFEWMDLLANVTHYPLWIYKNNQIVYKNSIINAIDIDFNHFNWNKNIGVVFKKEFFYLSFKYQDYIYVMGPILNHNQYSYQELEDIYIHKLKEKTIPDIKLGYYRINHTFECFEMWYIMATQESFPKENIVEIIETDLPFQRVQNNLMKNIVDSREMFTKYDFYDLETKLSREIVSGNIFNALEIVHSMDVAGIKKDLFISLITYISRSCVDVGVLKEDALELQDYLLKKLEDSNKVDDGHRVLKEMVTGYCELIKNKEKQDIYWLKIIIDYIHEHLHEPIDLKKLSHLVSRSPSYISAIFHKQMNISFSNYLMKLKLDEAKYLLKHTDLMIIEISMMLCFSSPSHFTKCFKKETGLSPKEYRLK